MILPALFVLGLVSPGRASADPSPVGALTEALNRRTSPSMLAFSCAPSHEVVRFFIAVAQGMSGPTLDVQHLATISRLSTAEGLVDLGIDPEGAITFVAADRSNVDSLILPFAGDAEQASRLFELVELAAEPMDGPVPTWWVPEEGADQGYTIRLQDRALEFRLGSRVESSPLPSPGVVGYDRELVGALPDGRGCAVHLVVDPTLLGEKAGGLVGQPVELAGFVPFTAGEAALMRLRAPDQVDLSFLGGGSAPLQVRSELAPAVVVALGFSFDDVLSMPGLAERLDLPPSRLARLGRWLNVDRGALVGLFGDPRELSFVAALPLNAATGPTAAGTVTRRLARLARKAEISVLYREDRALGLLLGKQILHAQVRDGLVVLGADSQRVLDVANGEGQPWVGTVGGAFAQEWALAMMIQLDGEGERGPMPAMGAGLRSRDGYLEIGVRLRDPLPLSTLVSGLSPVLGGPYAEAQADKPPEDLTAELTATMESIALAQRVHHSVNGVYLALPPAPRLAEQVDAEVVPWRRRAPWDRLGWEPVPAFTAGVFWVELDAGTGGFTVFAESDLDGDGVHARFRLLLDGEVERLSPTGVY